MLRGSRLEAVPRRAVDGLQGGAGQADCLRPSAVRTAPEAAAAPPSRNSRPIGAPVNGRAVGPATAFATTASAETAPPPRPAVGCAADVVPGVAVPAVLVEVLLVEIAVVGTSAGGVTRGAAGATTGVTVA